MWHSLSLKHTESPLSASFVVISDVPLPLLSSCVMSIALHSNALNWHNCSLSYFTTRNYCRCCALQAVLERPHVADALPDAAEYAPVAQKLGTCSLQPNPARRTSLAQYVILLCSPEKSEVEVLVQFVYLYLMLLLLTSYMYLHVRCLAESMIVQAPLRVESSDVGS
jgi:hypothetical protein